MIDTLTELQAAEILRRAELGGGWDISGPLGTTRATRIAGRGDETVVVELLQTPPAIMQRLSDLGVTPRVIALGESAGLNYMIQEAVDGPHPDHDWFRTNRAPWAKMISRYLNDPELAALLAAQPAFWRLDVAAAVDLIDRDLQRVPGNSPALRSRGFLSALDQWRVQAAALTSQPMRPIHPDPHWHNYLISNGVPLLLDWDYVDLSDPVRDVGYQIWGYLPRSYWTEFVRRLGLPIDSTDDAAICWWAGFKLLGNALFNARRGDHDGTRSHADMFLIAADNRPWLPPA